MIDEWGGTLQTVAFGVAMAAIGFWFGSSFTGRLAYQPDPLQMGGPPEWVGMTQTAGNVALAIAALGMIGVLGVDYYGQD